MRRGRGPPGRDAPRRSEPRPRGRRSAVGPQPGDRLWVITSHRAFVQKLRREGWRNPQLFAGAPFVPQPSAPALPVPARCGNAGREGKPRAGDAQPCGAALRDGAGGGCAARERAAEFRSVLFFNYYLFLLLLLLLLFVLFTVRLSRARPSRCRRRVRTAGSGVRWNPPRTHGRLRNCEVPLRCFGALSAFPLINNRFDFINILKGWKFSKTALKQRTESRNWLWANVGNEICPQRTVCAGNGGAQRGAGAERGGGHGGPVPLGGSSAPAPRLWL